MTTEQGNSIQADARYYTFGEDHRLPDGREAKGEYVAVMVSGGYDPRDVLIGWLGSNGFASEYDLDSWPRVRDKYYPGQDPAVILTVLVPPEPESGTDSGSQDEVDLDGLEAMFSEIEIGVDSVFVGQVEQFIGRVKAQTGMPNVLRLSLIVTASNARFLHEKSVDLGQVGMFLSAVALLRSAEEIEQEYQDAPDEWLREAGQDAAD